MKTLFAAPLALLTAFAMPAFAQDLALHEQRCWDETDEVAKELRIESCTALMQSDSVSDEEIPTLFTMRGWLQGELGEFELAVEDLSEAIRRAPQMGEAYGWRARALLEMGEYDRAIPDLTKALRLMPESEDAGLWYFGRAYSYATMGKWDLARDDYTRTIARWPDDAEPLLMRGSVFLEMEEYGPAIDDLSQATSLAPDDASAWAQLCWTRIVARGDLDQALAECDRALELEPEMAEALDSRGVVRLKQGQWEAAIEDFSAALTADPNQGASLYGRGIALARLGRADEAAANFRSAAEIEPTTAADYASYGLTP